MMTEVRDLGVEARKFLSAFPLFEALLSSLLSPCGLVFLLNDVIAVRGGSHRLIVDIYQAWELPNDCSITLKLVGMDDLWGSVFNQRSCQKSLRSLGIPTPSKENIEHEAVLVHSSS